MATTRPAECPACGHEGITRASPPDDRVMRGTRGGPARWTCRLCAYSWTSPGPARGYEELDSALP